MNDKHNIGINQYDGRQHRLNYQKEWRKLHPGYDKKMRNHEKVREAAWRRRYGITRDDYDRMLDNQRRCCAICKTKDIGRGHKYFHVDHDHETGKVRGLLCDLCNRGLGYFKDNSETLRKAAEYIENNGLPI